MADFGFVPDEEAPPTKDFGFVPEGEEPLTAKTAALNTLKGGVKALDYQGGASRAATLAPLIGMLSGKKVLSAEEIKKGLNPTTLDRVPDTATLLERAGMPEGGRFSDLAKGSVPAPAMLKLLAALYADPKQPHAAWRPEQGGHFDPTVRGGLGFAGDTLTDPATYETMGWSSLAKKAAAESASKAALTAAAKESAGPVGRAAIGMGEAGTAALDHALVPAETLAQGVGSLPLVGQRLKAALTAPSSLLAGSGKRLYESVLRPVEHEGARFGKSEVGDTLYKVGIKSPFGLGEKAKDATGTLLGARDALLTKAGASGAEVSMDQAMKEAEKSVAQIRASQDPQLQGVADAIEQKIAEYKNIPKGTPAVAPSIATETSPILDASGQPLMRERMIPGKPAVPGMAVTPSITSGYKSSLYNTLPGSAFDVATRTPVGQRMQKQMASGLKTGVEDSVAGTLGEEAGRGVEELNSDAGKLLTTRRSQGRVSNQVEKQADKLSQVSAVDLGAELLGQSAHIMPGAGFVAKKAADAARLGIMPMGYGMRTLGESRIAGPTLDNYLRRKAIDQFSPYAPKKKEEEK